jgi:acylphosphatase
VNPVVRYRVIVSGRVQGVWYRESCRREAIARNVRGWTRNNRDGTVEAVLEGSHRDVEQVVTWMRVGPPRAVVMDVEVHHEAPHGEQGFVVR